jgi:hypothetical protein
MFILPVLLPMIADLAIGMILGISYFWIDYNCYYSSIYLFFFLIYLLASKSISGPTYFLHLKVNKNGHFAALCIGVPD